MIKRFFILILVSSLITSCTWRHFGVRHSTKPVPTPSIVKQRSPIVVKQTTSPFTKINVTGKVDVFLHTNSKIHQIIMRADAEDIANVSREVKDNTLFIHVKKGYPKYSNLRLDINLRYITSINYVGSGSVIGRGIKAQCLDLVIDNDRETLLDGAFGIKSGWFGGSGRAQIRGVQNCEMKLTLDGNAHVELIGFANVANLKMQGNSDLNLYWLKSKTIKITLKDRSRAQLAGISDTLILNTWNESRFNGRYLMSKNSFIKTYNTSTAEISVTKNQHTLASDKSNIYYYFIPETKTDFMAEDGSILDMREWERPFLKDYNRYNR